MSTVMNDMLRGDQIAPVLGRVVGGGVKASMLMKADGKVLGTAGDWQSASEEGKEPVLLDFKIVGAIAANIWGDFDRAGQTLVDDGGGLQMMLLGLNKGNLGAACVGNGFLICLYANPDVKMGLIRLRMQTLFKSLHGALQDVKA
ncbi:unnamed protein product [Discosporangium mesarthrocarpum]